MNPSPKCKRHSSKRYLFYNLLCINNEAPSINRKNFLDGWEREGAAVAVYYKGELVVDLYGGYADASALRKWTPDTRTVVFSATKVQQTKTLVINQILVPSGCRFPMRRDARRQRPSGLQRPGQ